MVSREHVESLVSLANLAAHKSHQNLAELIARLPEDPTESRNLLLEVLPALIEEGANTASAAAELWYQQVRVLQVEDSFQSVLGAEPNPTTLEQNIRALAQVLFDRPAAEAKTALSSRLSELVERTVKDGARSTILANALKDPAATRFARVPAGSETCAFCHMLASRGWVYATKESASKAKKTGDSFHAGCDCQIVPAFGEQTPEIEGYDPEMFQARYEAGVQELNNRGTQNPTEVQITSMMRRIMPAIYSGARVNMDSPIRLDREGISRPDSKKWKHILVGDRKGGGHLYSSNKRNKTKFPSWWDEHQVEEAMEAVLRFGKADLGAAGETDIFGIYKGVLVQVKVREGAVGTVFPVGGDGVYFFAKDDKKYRRTLPIDSFAMYPDVYGRDFYRD